MTSWWTFVILGAVIGLVVGYSLCWLSLYLALGKNGEGDD